MLPVCICHWWKHSLCNLIHGIFNVLYLYWCLCLYHFFLHVVFYQYAVTQMCIIKQYLWTLLFFACLLSMHISALVVCIYGTSWESTQKAQISLFFRGVHYLLPFHVLAYRWTDRTKCVALFSFYSNSPKGERERESAANCPWSDFWNECVKLS